MPPQPFPSRMRLPSPMALPAPSMDLQRVRSGERLDSLPLVSAPTLGIMGLRPRPCPLSPQSTLRRPYLSVPLHLLATAAAAPPPNVFRCWQRRTTPLLPHLLLLYARPCPHPPPISLHPSRSCPAAPNGPVVPSCLVAKSSACPATPRLTSWPMARRSSLLHPDPPPLLPLSAFPRALLLPPHLES